MKAAVRISLAWLLAILLILFLAWNAGYIQSFLSQLNIVEKPLGEDMVAVNKPLLISVVDPVAGSAVSGATVYIYDGTTLMETLTTDVNGQATTALRYPSGKQLNILVVSGDSKCWYQVEVPYMNRVDAEAASTNYISIQFFTLGSYTIKAIDQFGNVYASGSTLNFTTLGADSVTLTIQIYNTVDNTGYKSSYDPLNKVYWKAVLVASASSPKSIWSGFDRTVDRGTTTYLLKVVPDDELVRQKVGTQYVKDGVYSFTVTINKGSLSGLGTSETWTLTLYVYFDPDYFAQTGIGSNDALAVATFNLVVGT